MMTRSAVIALVAAGMMWGANLPRKAPEFTLQVPGGAPIKLSSYKGKVVVLAFILTTCPHCKEATGHFVKLQNEYGPKGLQIIEVATDQQGSAQKAPVFAREMGTNFPVGYLNAPLSYLDFMQHPMAEVPYVPMIAFIDRDGTIRDQMGGKHNDPRLDSAVMEKSFRTEIESLLKPPAAAAKTKKTK